ncbi:hypothetical protein N6H18_13465 [Reichenbachiella agarivorans]|uniref:Outer membrane protein beta-barrel domain-containing protein n=1 Tax=Reichenbachiella agarivorans TaxID=2979464 RepID=A0ABY6CPH1_9BACT|nr:hypothetical protein [Reichenbachiella agarivorans]UXP31358.1 hypothetical protein N6H18_13465 [Reichenbachiella agarivorans]
MKKLILLALFVSCFELAWSQESMFNINWQIATPVGEFKDFIEETSAQGLNIGGRKFFSDFLSVGGYTGWQVYYQKQRGLQHIEDGLDAYGTQIRYINIYPIMANAHLYAGQDGDIRPYLGLNTGVSFVNQKVQIGLWDVSKTTTHFTLAPEVGVFIPIGLYGGGLNFSGRYDQAFQSSNDFHIQGLIFNIGFAMTY